MRNQHTGSDRVMRAWRFRPDKLDQLQGGVREGVNEESARAILGSHATHLGDRSAWFEPNSVVRYSDHPDLITMPLDTKQRRITIDGRDENTGIPGIALLFMRILKPEDIADCFELRVGAVDAHAAVQRFMRNGNIGDFNAALAELRGRKGFDDGIFSGLDFGGFELRGLRWGGIHKVGLVGADPAPFTFRVATAEELAPTLVRRPSADAYSRMAEVVFPREVLDHYAEMSSPEFSIDGLRLSWPARFVLTSFGVKPLANGPERSFEVRFGKMNIGEGKVELFRSNVRSAIAAFGNNFELFYDRKERQWVMRRSAQKFTVASWETFLDESATILNEAVRLWLSEEIDRADSLMIPLFPDGRLPILASVLDTHSRIFVPPEESTDKVSVLAKSLGVPVLPRDTFVDDLVLRDDTLAFLQSQALAFRGVRPIINEGDVNPFLLFTGPAGIGKTALAKLMASLSAEHTLFFKAEDRFPVENRVPAFREFFAKLFSYHPRYFQGRGYLAIVLDDLHRMFLTSGDGVQAMLSVIDRIGAQGLPIAIFATRADVVREEVSSQLLRPGRMRLVSLSTLEREDRLSIGEHVWRTERSGEMPEPLVRALTNTAYETPARVRSVVVNYGKGKAGLGGGGEIKL